MHAFCVFAVSLTVTVVFSLFFLLFFFPYSFGYLLGQLMRQKMLSAVRCPSMSPGFITSAERDLFFSTHLFREKHEHVVRVPSLRDGSIRVNP